MSVPDPQSLPPVTSRLLASVADELAMVAEEIGDAGLAGRLEHASALLAWVRGRLDVDEDASAELAREVTRLSAGADGSGLLRKSIHRLLDSMRPADTRVAEPSAGSPAAGDKPVSPVDVTTYLRARRPGSTDEAHEVRAILGGFSKRTLLVAATLDGVRQEIVLRQVPAGRRARSLAPEFEVVRAVYAAGLPVPEPMWIEPEDNALGGAFFVTRRAPGSNVGDVWGARGVSKDVCLEVASIYARLHQLDVEGVPMPVSPRSTPEELHEMISWQESTLAKRRIEIEPVLAALLAWLRAHVPAAPARRSLIHGDAAFSNLLIEDGTVTAVLDWEAAHIGDPAEELAYLRPSVEPVLPWEEFIGHYVAAADWAPDPEVMRFFEVWSHVWRHIGCLWLAQNYDASRRYASAIAAYVHGPRFLAEGVTAAFGPP
ncbi:phosphotransferase family protein [Sphaerisporangium sp. NPDC051017]|uniref:phosphotransferase family protein n=1 Tax=Sphaerisporangium sp. NPDC051017 TaxID=3154636 RepID=UPI00344A9C13